MGTTVRHVHGAGAYVVRLRHSTVRAGLRPTGELGSGGSTVTATGANAASEDQPVGE